MKRNIRFVFSITSIFIIILFLANIFSINENSLSDFLEAYLNNAQKLLFLISAFIAFLSLTYITPIINPIIIIRVKDILFSYLLKYGIKFSFLLTVAIFSSFLISGILVDLDFDISLSVFTLVIKFFLFILTFYCIITSIYFLSKKIIFAILSGMFMNFIFIAILFSVDFFVMNNEMSKLVERLCFEIYISICLVGGILFLFFKSEELECLCVKK
jgi:hypothetical protein